MNKLQLVNPVTKENGFENHKKNIIKSFCFYSRFDFRDQNHQRDDKNRNLTENCKSFTNLRLNNNMSKF